MIILTYGSVAEWLKAPLSKSGIGETLSEVRILPLPPMIILGIETSCDETAVSVIEAEGGLEDLRFKALGSAVNSQIETHREFGGVVPNIAKREHLKNLPLVLMEALKEAGLIFNELKDPSFPIDLIAVTVGPGLEPALWTGIKFAEELGQKWNIPVVGTNHMEGHIASVLFKTEANSKRETRNARNSFGFEISNFEFPAIALLVSGGHTELIYLKNWLERKKIGHTLDDAVGEAFDKVARMLGAPYPGGPEISKLAEEARMRNIKLKIKFPRPMLHSNDLNFSFSGLKTAVLYYLRDEKDIDKPAVAREFEDAVVETLITKTKAAIEGHDPKTLIIGGGVIANKALRENLMNLEKDYPKLKILIPEKSLTTDNATMIAAAGYIEYLRGEEKKELKAQGNLSISS